MDAHRRHKTPDSKTEDFIIRSPIGPMSIRVFVLVPLAPESHGGDVAGPRIFHM